LFVIKRRPGVPVGDVVGRDGKLERPAAAARRVRGRRSRVRRAQRIELQRSFTRKKLA
jgi:hypothetical protein